MVWPHPEESEGRLDQEKVERLGSRRNASMRTWDATVNEDLNEAFLSLEDALDREGWRNAPSKRSSLIEQVVQGPGVHYVKTDQWKSNIIFIIVDLMNLSSISNFSM